MRRASGPNVSLFPFLTVLLCASGTLIVLLIALSQHVRETPPAELADAAEAEPDAVVVPEPTQNPEPIKPPAPAPSPELPTVPKGPPRVVRLPYEGPDPREPLRRRLDDARGAAVDVNAAIRAAAIQRRESQDRIAAARIAATEASAALASAQARFASLEQTRESGKSAVARATAEVAEFQAAVASAEEDDSPRALLPVVRTPDGVTADRPILIECVAAGATLHPYGVTVPAAAAGPSPNGLSPIAAGVKAASQATGESYVLLIVRPDGLPAFYRAANALSDAGVRFGYELLDEDAEIAWGETNGDTAAAIADAVQTAIQRMPIDSMEDDGFGIAGVGPAGFPGSGGQPNAPTPGAGGGGTSQNGAAGLAHGGTPSLGMGVTPYTQGGARGPAGRPDLSSSFPAGSPADRLSVNGPTPAIAARQRGMTGDRFQAAAQTRVLNGAGTPASGSPSSASRPGPANSAASEAADAGPPKSGPPSEDSPFTGAPGSEAPDAGAPATDSTGAEVNAPGGSGGGRARSGSDATSGGTAFGSPSDGGDGGDGGSGSGDAGKGSSSGSSRRAFGNGGEDGRGGAAERDNRIRFTVRTPATLAASHLWINDRWTPLPPGNEELVAVLRSEFHQKLADRGDPPAGFRWSPEVRLSVRRDGVGQVERLIEAVERAGGTVKIEGGRR